MKLYVANRETGYFIDEVESVEEGLKLIDQYESEDKADGTYEENFYDIVDEEHFHVEV